MLQRVAACCSIFQRIAVCCSVLQCVAVREKRARYDGGVGGGQLQCVVYLMCSMLQCVAVCCNVLQCVAVCCSVLQCVAVCCSVLHSVAVCEERVRCGKAVERVLLQCVAYVSLLQCIAVYDDRAQRDVTGGC